jgi:hypothetical protein
VLSQWWRMVDDAAKIWFTAPQVIALRSARMLAGGLAPRADDRRELARMVNEKTAAAGESATAMAVQVWRTNWELALLPLRLWSGMWTGVGRTTPFAAVTAASKIAQSGLAPVRRRVTANAKRLRRRTAR